MRRKGVAVRLKPAPLDAYRCLYVDVFSVAAALSDREELFRSFSQFSGRAVFVVDAWHESHLPLARHYTELCRKWLIDCVLSEHKPAEEYAVELACRDGSTRVPTPLARVFKQTLTQPGRCAAEEIDMGMEWRWQPV